MPTRQPIVCVLGHVDTGKTLLLDKIRKTSVGAREAGGITQHIGASFFPVETLSQLIGPLLSKVKGEIEIPGLLMIDTPGHEAFTNLRKRGGSVADIAILVINVLRGFEAQTFECVEILKARKTPFLVAANMIDRVPGWNSYPDTPFSKSYPLQDPYVREKFREMIEGFISTIHSGGNMSAYLREKSRQYMRLKKLSLKKYSDTLSMLSEAYVALLLTGPLFLVIMLAVMAMLGGGGLGLLSPDMLLNLLTYLAIPLGAIVFLIILDASSPKW